MNQRHHGPCVIGVFALALVAGIAAEGFALPVFTSGVEQGLGTPPGAGVYTTVVTVSGGAVGTHTVGNIVSGRDDFLGYTAFDVTAAAATGFPNPPYGFTGLPPFTLRFTYRPHRDRRYFKRSGGPKADIPKVAVVMARVARRTLESARPLLNGTVGAPTIQLWVDPNTATTQAGAPVAADSEFYKYQISY